MITSNITVKNVNPLVAELLLSIYHYLKLELLTQFPALNKEK